MFLAIKYFASFDREATSYYTLFLSALALKQQPSPIGTILSAREQIASPSTEKDKAGQGVSLLILKEVIPNWHVSIRQQTPHLLHS